MIFNLKLVRNAPGLITEGESWCIIDFSDGYLYGPCDSAEECVVEMMIGWKHDKNLVG